MVSNTMWGIKMGKLEQIHVRGIKTDEIEVNDVNTVCARTHSLAWSLVAYRTLTTAVSVSVFTVRIHKVSTNPTMTVKVDQPGLL